MPRPLLLPRTLLTLTALTTTFGPFLADFSTTHVYNPNWPPHAKFHNGQTMSTGAALGALTLFYTWRRASSPRENLRMAAVLGSLYWGTALTGVLYPGAKAVDPEFGEGFPQFWPFLGLGIVPWVAVWLV